jgi:hypothetical protein
MGQASRFRHLQGLSLAFEDDEREFKRMTRRNLLYALGLGIVGVGAVAPAAYAQRYDHYDRYYGQRYYRGRDRDDIYRRGILRDRLIDLGDRIRLAEREGALSRRRANDLYRDLDDVRDFLRDDRNLTQSEFERRSDDLRDVARDLRQAMGSRYDRYRSSSYEDWYGRYDSRDRYDRYRDRGRYDDRYDDRYRR